MPVVRGKNIEPLYSAEQIAERNRDMAKHIASGPTKDLLVIAVLKDRSFSRPIYPRAA